MPQGIGGWGIGQGVGTLQGVTRASGEMADALASGASDRKIVGVQVPPRPLDVASVRYEIVRYREGRDERYLHFGRISN